MVASINAAILQDIDPFKNPAYQPLIDRGMEFAGKRLRIPDIKACMILTVKTLTRAREAMDKN